MAYSGGPGRLPFGLLLALFGDLRFRGAADHRLSDVILLHHINMIKELIVV